jgi:aminoglycoside/choline kinase family phosphotransferase
MNSEELILLELYKCYACSDAAGISLLPGSGSYRKYYRIQTQGNPVIGVFNNDSKENEAFYSFTRHFLKLGLPVPELLAFSEKEPAYLLSDLGDKTLFGFLSESRKNEDDFPEKINTFYKKVISWLPRFQVEANKELDYSKCYPRPAFDRQSMMWDLNYFKYYFLKLAKIPFDEQKLEDDFVTLTDFLLTADADFFLYRDFQSRNVMVVGSEPWFIDYQGGRKGPLQYDIASLLFDAKAAIPESVRNDLLLFYLKELNRYTKVNPDQFIRLYDGFVLIRILQAMGAYGFRGYYENKPHFLQSIPFAVKNFEYLLKNYRIPIKIPMLTTVLEKIIANPGFQRYQAKENSLVVSVYSFSYKKGVPKDNKGNGGGFTFDCRALPNPGKFEEYKKYSGKDQPVIEYLQKEPSVDEFLNHTFAIVDLSVKKYIERDFSSLVVSFGCTGGQHRSVFCAEALARHIRSKFSVIVELIHLESDNFQV